MIKADLYRELGILTVAPEGPLEAADFEALAGLVDPFIEDSGDLKGLLIDATAFQGWDSFADSMAHLRFVREHQRHIRKVAAVADSSLVTVMASVARPFLHAELRHFAPAERDKALAWLQEPV